MCPCSVPQTVHYFLERNMVKGEGRDRICSFRKNSIRCDGYSLFGVHGKISQGEEEPRLRDRPVLIASCRHRQYSKGGR